MNPSSPPTLMRQHDDAQGHRVTSPELFFDLVFVFAVTQLSHFLLEHFTLLGAAQTGVLLLAVWWAWVFTAWVTNWLDPERLPVRLMLIVLMLVGLLLSAALPGAFGERGLMFALAYVTFQVGRSAFTLWAMREDETQRRNFTRLLIWLVIGGTLWLAGALSPPETRLAWWLGALAVEYTGPAVGFFLPGLGRSATQEWTVSGEHMAERAGLFVIVALGESVLVTGATFAELQWTPLTSLALTVTFLGSVALWWTYFVVNADVVARTIRDSDDPGRLARFAYTYLHVPIVAGIVLSAVGDELLLTHPVQDAGATEVWTVVGGPLVFLLGNLLFKRAATGRPPTSHLVGMALLAALMVAAPGLPSVVVGGLVGAVLMGVAVWESRGRTPLRGADRTVA